MSLQDAFRDQAGHCAALGSPFMARLLTGLARDWPAQSDLGRKCATWSGDVGPGGASLPLRVAGGLHALVLSGRAPDLAAVYPPHEVPDAALNAAVLAAIDCHAAFLSDWIETAPQTNEVRRSAALVPAAHVIARRHALPFVLSELGASGGLNLMFDRFAVRAGPTVFGPADPALTLTPDWDGPVPDRRPITVADRRGVDLNPLDLRDPDQALRLMAFLWPDQPHRAALTRQAMEVLEATVDQGDAVDWLAPRLDAAPDGHVHLIYHTVAWQYFPPDRQALGRRLIEAAGARATEDRPLAWLALENDGGEGPGAALTLRLWPGDLHFALGRADFHGRWINWSPREMP